MAEVQLLTESWSNKELQIWSSRRGAVETNPTTNHEVEGSIPGLAHGSRIWRCCELWYRPQTRLGLAVAVAVAQAGGYSSDLTPSLGTSVCRGCGPKKTKAKKEL